MVNLGLPREVVSRINRMRAVQHAIFILALVGLVSAIGVSQANAASAEEINATADQTLRSFVRQVPGAKEIAQKAAGVLVFPSVVKAGIGFGGEYGEGIMLVKGGQPGGYYNLVSASFGFQLGVQERSIIIMFMTQDALDRFSRTSGWKVGVDGSVTIIAVGVGGSIDTDKITSPVIGFVLDQKGLMYNLTLEGSKISRIER